jgi:hypothetical protein
MGAEKRGSSQRNSGKRSRGGGGKTIAIIAAIVVLLGCCCFGVPGGVAGFGWWQLGWFDGGPKKDGVVIGKDAKPPKDGGVGGNPLKPVVVSIDAFQRIQFGMTPAEVEAILGAGSPATEADVSKVHDRMDEPSGVGFQWKKRAKDSQVKAWTEWRSGVQVIHVGFRATKMGDLATIKMGAFNSIQIPGAIEYQTDNAPGVVDLGAKRDEKVRLEKLFGDPKWAKGADIRQLLVGRWNSMLKGSPPYEFALDGSLKTKDFVGKDLTGKYAFQGDDQIKISLPNIFSGQPNDKVYKVLVAQDDLILLDQSAVSLNPREQFRRVKLLPKK